MPSQSRTRDIIRSLLDGSKQINLMREEVKMIVSMVKDALEQDHVSPPNQGLMLRGENCAWSISGKEIPIGSQNVIPKVEIRCRVRFRKYGVQYDLVGYSTSSGAVPFKLECVQAVHQVLHTLVNGILENFPQIRNHWQPLFEAAKVRV